MFKKFFGPAVLKGQKTRVRWPRAKIHLVRTHGPGPSDPGSAGLWARATQASWPWPSGHSFGTKKARWLGWLALAHFIWYKPFIPSQQLMDHQNENERRQFLMAQLTFLRSLLANMPKLLSGLAPLIVQLLPDFFIQVN